MSTDDAYEERYGFALKTLLLITGCVVFVLAAAFVPMPLAARILSLLLFGSGAVVFLVNALSRKVALRVDQSGITLGGSPLRYAATTAHIPWQEVEAVVLWRQELAHRLPYLGVLRPHAAPPLPGVPTGVGGQALMSVAQSVASAPDDRLVGSCRAITGWQLDIDQLAAALRRFAPGVPLFDHR